MNGTKEIRESLGLSQQQLADYLGITRTQIGMWETRRRELPTPAFLKLSALVSGLHNNVQLKQQPQQQLSERDCAALHRHAKNCLYKALAVKRELEDMQQKYHSCMQALAVIDYLQNNLLQSKEAKKDRTWLELLQIETSKKLRKCGPAAQFKIKLNLKALEMQAEEAGKAGN